MILLNWNLKMAREFWKYVWVKWLYVKFAEKVKRVKKGVKEDRWGTECHEDWEMEAMFIKTESKMPTVYG